MYIAKRVKAYTAIPNGGQEVPINESTAFGIAFMTFEDDEKLLHYSIAFTDAFPGGEIRGQALPVRGLSFKKLSEGEE